jgi:lysophospholipid acyltransferase (LPLAT)-like uncharacterized protein
MALNPELNWKKKLVLNGVERFIFFTGITSQITIVGEEIIQKSFLQAQPTIVCLWHQDIYFSAWLLRNLDLTALISSSKDGEYIYRVLRKFGFTAVRGSSTRGGISAMKQLVRCLKAGNSVAITPDGPQGPVHKVQEGIIALAKMTGAPIIPWKYEGSACWSLSSWDSHKIPKPFSKIQSAFGKPLFVPKSACSSDLAKYCQQLETMMSELLPESEQKK